MDFTTLFAFDQLVAAFVATVVIREVLIMVLPESLAGPGGWLIDTGIDEEA